MGELADKCGENETDTNHNTNNNNNTAAMTTVINGSINDTYDIIEDIEVGLDRAKACGRFQIVLQFVTMYLILTTGYQGLFSYFIFDDPPWRCDPNITNTTSKFCRTYQNLTFPGKNTSRCTIPRKDWIYTRESKYSVVTEYDLVCDQVAAAATASSALYIGGLIGVMVAGKVGDMWGRKPVIILCLFVTTVLSIGSGFVTSVWQLTVLRGILGAFYVSYFTIAYVLLMEYVAPKYRTASGIMFNTMFCLSLILLTGVAYLVPRWRDLQIYCSLPALLALIFMIFFVPESPRWLLAMQRNEAAATNLRKVAAHNGRSLPTLALRAANEEITNYTYFDLLRYGKVAMITTSQGLLWMTSAVIYYTLGLESSSIGGDMYLVFIYSQLAEIPSNLVTIFCCDFFGRKKTILGSLLVAGVFTACISIQVGDAHDRYIFNLTMAILAKFFVTVTYNGTYVWAFEVFPTVVRSQGVGFCSICERIGGLVAPYFVGVLQEANPILPFVIMGILAAGSSVIGLIQPETNKLPTRELFEDFYEKDVEETFEDPPPTKKKVIERVNPMYEGSE